MPHRLRCRLVVFMGVLAGLVLFGPPTGMTGDLAGQEENRPTFALETGVINFGPLVTEERDKFVRFGSNDGMESYFALDIASNGHYVRLLLAPTQLHAWPTDETTTDALGDPPRSSDPRQSRFHYRVKDDPIDSFLWASLSGGWRLERSPMTVRLGGGIVTLSQTAHSVWGARVGVAPMLETSVGASWRSLEATCGGQVLGLGYGLGRWIVLEHIAGTSPESGERRRRLVRPLHCGVSLRM